MTSFKVIVVSEKAILKRKVIFLLTGSCALIPRTTGRKDFTRNHTIGEKDIKRALYAAFKINQTLPTVNIPF